MNNQNDQFAIDSGAIEWTEKWSEYNQMHLYEKSLVNDSDTGMMINRMIYPKGFVTRWHTHPCSHGIYVLSGKLKTNKGVYGPGTIVWFPEGVLAEHGSTDEEDVEVLFITNKTFALHFQDGGAV